MAGRTDFEALVYQMSADIKRLETANNKALGIINSTADKGQKRYDRLGAEAGRSWGRIEAAAAFAFGAIAGYSIKAASDANELQNAFDKAFGAGKDGARAYAKTLSSEVGRSSLEVQEGLMQFRLLLKKLDGDTADAIAKRLQARAIDVGSLYNVSDQEVITKFLSGISGESEPLKSLGVTVNETAVKLELMRLGFKGNAEQAPEAAKQVARVNIMLRETEIAAGDAAGTLDSAANQAKRAKGEFRDAAAELGANFLPIATKAAKAAGDMAEAFGKMPDSLQIAGLALLGLVVVGGPIARVIAGLQALIKWAGAARLAMATIGVGGAAKRAAGAVGAGLGVGTAIVAADAANQDAQDDISGVYADRLTRDDSLETRMARLAASDAKIERALAWLRARPGGKNAERIKSLEALRAQRANAPFAAAAAAAGTPSATDPAIGQFALPDALKAPIAGTKASGSAASKAAAAANKARDQNDRMEDALAAAKAREVAAQRDLTRSIELRAQGALDDLDMEEAARNADLDRQVKDKALTQAQADRIKAAEALARSAERAVITAGEEEDLAEANLRQSQVINDYYDQIASIRAGMARTELERFRIEERALQARQREEATALRDRLGRQVANGEKTQSAADAELASQGDLQRAQVDELFDRQVKKLAAGMRDAFESQEGVVVWLANRFKDQLKNQLYETLAQLLMSLASAGQGDHAGGWLSAGASALASLFAGEFAGGGTIPAGQWGIVNDGGAEAIRARPGGGIDVMNNGALRALQASRPGAAGATRISYHTEHKTFDLRGAVLTNEIWAEIRAVDQRSAQRTQAVAGALGEATTPWAQSARAAETDSFRS